MGKIKDLKRLLRILKNEKKLGRKIGYVIGCFDVLHEEHVKYLDFVKSKVNVLVVGLNSDRSIQQSKGGSRPVNQIRSRLLTLAGLGSVDYVFAMNDYHRHGTAEAIKYERYLAVKINPDVIATNIAADSGCEEKRYQAKLIGAEFLDYRAARTNSSSRIIAKLGLEI